MMNPPDFRVPSGWWRRLAPFITVVSVLSLSLSGLLWSLAPMTAGAADDPEVSFGWPTVYPTKVVAGGWVLIRINAQAKELVAPDKLTFVARVIDRAGKSAEISRQRDITFTAWQTQRFAAAWEAPDNAALGTATLRFEMIASSGVVVAARETTVTIVDDDGWLNATPTATRTPTPTEAATKTPTQAPAQTATNTSTPTRTPVGGSGNRPPQRCDQEFQIVGSADFVSGIWSQLAAIYSVSPADYDRVMTCIPASSGRTMTEVRRIIQADPGYSSVNGYYSDWTGTIWLEKGVGLFASSMLVHEAAHITTTGWSVRGGSCEPENRALEVQAVYLDRAAAAVSDPNLASALRFYADWYRSQKNKHNCPPQ